MYKIGNKNFETKKAAEEFTRRILNNCPIGSHLTGEELTFIYSLLENHPEAENKIGVGIKSIAVNLEERFKKTKCFIITRVDDTITDFSFYKCLTPSLNDPIKLFNGSAREAVAEQIVTYKNTFYKENQDSSGCVQCVLTKLPINRQEAHVDHTPPNTFNKIVLDYKDINDIDVDKIEFAENSTGIGRIFKDSKLRNDFAHYHMQTAKLRVISATENLKLKKK